MTNGTPPATPPATPTDYFALYESGMWDLGSVLKPVRKIVFAIMEREAIDYEQAIAYLVGEYFVTPYVKYVAKYLSQGKDVAFDRWCRIEFAYRVRRGYAYTAKRHRIACTRGFGAECRSLDDIQAIESHARLETPGDQLQFALQAEREALRGVRDSLVIETLKDLEPMESFIVWNHAALGHTYDDIAGSLGISPTTAKKIYVGVTARLRREADECTM